MTVGQQNLLVYCYDQHIQNIYIHSALGQQFIIEPGILVGEVSSSSTPWSFS